MAQLTITKPELSVAERLAGLQFLIHFVGDLHQPLHASDDHDSGGHQKARDRSRVLAT
jgi:hypothetical protein